MKAAFLKMLFLCVRVYTLIYILLMQQIVNSAYSIIILCFIIINWKIWQSLKCHDNSNSLSHAHFLTCSEAMFTVVQLLVLLLWCSSCFSFSCQKILYINNLTKKGFILAHCLGRDTIPSVVAWTCDSWSHCHHSQKAERWIWVFHSLSVFNSVLDLHP